MPISRTETDMQSSGFSLSTDTGLIGMHTRKRKRKSNPSSDIPRFCSNLSVLSVEGKTKEIKHENTVNLCAGGKSWKETKGMTQASSG